MSEFNLIFRFPGQAGVPNHNYWFPTTLFPENTQGVVRIESGFSLSRCIPKILYIHIIKVLFEHSSKSRQLLVAHLSSKVMIENTLNKIPVCLYVCMYGLSVCLRGFLEKLLTIHVKRLKGLLWNFTFGSDIF